MCFVLLLLGMYTRTMGYMSSVQPMHTFTQSMALSGLDEVNIRLYNFNPMVSVKVLGNHEGILLIFFRKYVIEILVMLKCTVTDYFRF